MREAKKKTAASAAAACALLVGVLAVAGCAPEEPSITSPSTSASPSPSPTPTSAAPTTEEEAIEGALAAAREFYRLWDAIKIEGTTDTSSLDGLVVGEARTYIDALVANTAASGQEVRGGSVAYDLIPDGYTGAHELADEPGVFGFATLFGCADARSLEIYDATGEQLPGALTRAVITARFDVDDERWLIERFEPSPDEEGECDA